MKRKSIVILILSTLSITTAIGGFRVPVIPENKDYTTLSAREQKDLEAAAFILNLRSLDILDPKSPICASVEQDENGNPRFRFAIQGEAFETGSCALKQSDGDTIQRLQKLAAATQTYYREVRDWKGPVPMDVSGFSDGQRFSKVGEVAAKDCPELSSSRAVGKSYNQPLAITRANRVIKGLKLDQGFDVKVNGYSSPHLEAQDLACSTRRQVVVSIGGVSTTDNSATVGVFEPGARVDHSVQLAMNSAVSLGILRAHQKSKATADCSSADNERSRSLCRWKHLQKVMTELGIAESDIACRATTLALANEVISRADAPFANGGKNEPWQNEMLEMASNPAAAQSKIRAFISESAKKEKRDEKLHECGSSGALHIAIPTSDMLNSRDPKCARTSAVSRAVQAAEQSKGKFPSKDFPGIPDGAALRVYQQAMDSGIARRNLSHNCVKPDPAILAIGYELSPNQADFFQDPAALGEKPVQMNYTPATFGSTFHPQKGAKGFGCSACGSGLQIQKDGKLKFENGVASGVSNKSGDLVEAFGDDGMNLLRSKEPTAASFLAPSAYQIPNCPGCSCVSNMKDALRLALKNGPILRSVNLGGKPSEMSLKEMRNTCIFTPAVSHACPVGPTGESEQAKVASESETKLMYIDKTLTKMVGAQVSGKDGIQKALSEIVRPACVGCNLEPLDLKVPDLQSMVNEVSCETKSPPVHLPTRGTGKSAETKDCSPTDRKASSVN